MHYDKEFEHLKFLSVYSHNVLNDINLGLISKCLAPVVN
jgi:hypothetical protein